MFVAALIFVGAEDNVLWDTRKYIRRMMKRPDELPHDCTAEALLYEHGSVEVEKQYCVEFICKYFDNLLKRVNGVKNCGASV